ncbi:hypothetical protein [Streptomyces sp. KR55]|uniref:hypothetical protein n=1 Tax=Streptomyces sp. KR55 TaxID=3457425 RepID=UPI003FD1D254
MTNDGTETAVVSAALRGHNAEVHRRGQLLGGATLVDSANRRRYYVLRDTEGRPLTTTGIVSLNAGERVPVYMQFPTPPSTIAEVAFQLPRFDIGILRLSGESAHARVQVLRHLSAVGTAQGVPPLYRLRVDTAVLYRPPGTLKGSATSIVGHGDINGAVILVDGGVGMAR